MGTTCHSKGVPGDRLKLSESNKGQSASEKPPHHQLGHLARILGQVTLRGGHAQGLITESGTNRNRIQGVLIVPGFSEQTRQELAGSLHQKQSVWSLLLIGLRHFEGSKQWDF